MLRYHTKRETMQACSRKRILLIASCPSLCRFNAQRLGVTKFVASIARPDRRYVGSIWRKRKGFESKSRLYPMQDWGCLPPFDASLVRSWLLTLEKWLCPMILTLVTTMRYKSSADRLPTFQRVDLTLERVDMLMIRGAEREWITRLWSIMVERLICALPSRYRQILRLRPHMELHIGVP